MDKQLVMNRCGDVITTSKLVAEKFGKKHKNVMRSISNLLEDPEVAELGWFEKQRTTNTQNFQLYDYYNLTKDGFVLLVMGFTGKKARKFKIEYIKAFDQMAKELHKPRFVETLIPEEVKLYTTTYIAGKYHMTAHELNKWLKQHGKIHWNACDQCYELSVFYQGYGYTRVVQGTSEWGTGYRSMQWTPAGAGWIHELLANNGMGDPDDEKPSAVHPELYDNQGMLKKSGDLF